MQNWNEDVLSQVSALDTMAEEVRAVDLSSTQVVIIGWGLGECKAASLELCGDGASAMWQSRSTEPWEHTSVSLPAGVNPGSVANSFS